MKIFITLIIFSLSALSHGEAVWKEGEVSWVYPQANGSFAVTFKDPSPDCTHSSGYHYAKVGENSVTQEGLNNMYSLALVAATTGKKLKVNFKSESSACFVNRMYIVF
ncbi:hypothetical protein SAMN02745866_00317 [Alteromonadaceae bacterium Bs31]|nr:hypothetical protein SAMN02745866_00317 [Alteromonadaceae bacterium Bs31]